MALDAAAMVARSYRLLRTHLAAHVAADGTRTEGVPVIFSAGGGAAGLDGLVSADSPSITLPTAAIPGRVVRAGERLEFGAGAWLARAAGVPLRDGEELAVSLKRA